MCVCVYLFVNANVSLYGNLGLHTTVTTGERRRTKVNDHSIRIQVHAKGLNIYTHICCVTLSHLGLHTTVTTGERRSDTQGDPEQRRKRHASSVESDDDNRLRWQRDGMKQKDKTKQIKRRGGNNTCLNMCE